MSEAHLSNDEFLSSLAKLFTERREKDHGSIHLVQKRMAYGQDEGIDVNPPTNEEPFPDLYLAKPLPILIRASNGKSKERRKKKVKLSTVVQPDDLEGFYTKYAEVCKAGMSGLKKRDRKGAKEKLKAKKKQGAGTGTGTGVETKKA